MGTGDYGADGAGLGEAALENGNFATHFDILCQLAMKKMKLKGERIRTFFE